MKEENMSMMYCLKKAQRFFNCVRQVLEESHEIDEAIINEIDIQVNYGEQLPEYGPEYVWIVYLLERSRSIFMGHKPKGNEMIEDYLEIPENTAQFLVEFSYKASERFQGFNKIPKHQMDEVYEQMLEEYKEQKADVIEFYGKYTPKTLRKWEERMW